MTEDMSAEYGPNPGSSQEFGRSLQPAVDGTSFAQIPDNQAIPKQLNASLGGRGVVRKPVPGGFPVPEGRPGPGGRKFPGVRGRVAAATLAFLAASGLGAFFASQQMDGDGEGQRGGAVDMTPSSTEDSKTTTQTYTPEKPTQTATPTEIPISERLPYEILNENVYGDIGVGIIEGTNQYSECQPKKGVIIQCPGIEELYLDEAIDPEGEMLKKFEQDLKWMAWKDRNPEDDLTKEEFKDALDDPNSSFVVTVRGYSGASYLAEENIEVDLKKKIHFVQTPFSQSGLYKLDENWRGSIRSVKGELYLEMTDASNGGLAEEYQLPQYGAFPRNYGISYNMLRIGAIFIDSESQKAGVNIVVDRGGQILSIMDSLKVNLTTEKGTNGLIKAKAVTD